HYDRPIEVLFAETVTPLADESTPVQSGGDAAADNYRLVTTLLDSRRYPARHLAALYRERWEIESVFAEIKTCQRGAKVVLSSKTPDGVLQQIWAHLLVHHA
ncbi:transposase, partial [Streptomyces sp. SP17KL33]|uniref:transposase n=1 Tax=Streptomyces sp. SP17KL33 TaxID=3002534 RepID=UPI002E77A91A